MATFLATRKLSNQDGHEPASAMHDRVREVAEDPDWEKIGQEIAARYPNTLAKLAE
jgi:hypothetical protein